MAGGGSGVPITILTPGQFSTKYAGVFPDNNTGAITEAMLRLFAYDISISFEPRGTPPTPDGVSFITTPTYSISGNTVTESTAAFEYGGVTKNVATQALTIPYATSGKKRKYAVGVKYLETTPVYFFVAGTEVLSSAGITPYPVIPPDMLFGHYLDVTDAAIAPGPTDAIKSISINKGDPLKPDANGNLDLTIPDASKFKGNYVNGAKGNDTYWVSGNKVWRTKQAFTSAIAPTQANAYWELVIDASGYTDAQALAAAIANIGTGATNFAAGTAIQPNEYSTAALTPNVTTGIVDIDWLSKKNPQRSLILTQANTAGTPLNYPVAFSNATDGATLTLPVINNHSTALNIQIPNDAGTVKYRVMESAGSRLIDVASGGFTVITVTCAVIGTDTYYIIFRGNY